MRKPPNSRACARTGCKSRLYGQQQVCDACRAKDLLCQAPGCGKPHGGMPGSTKLCPPCRAKTRSVRKARKHAPWTDREDAILRDVYAKHHGHEALAKLLALFPSRPRWAFIRRAQLLGATTVRTKEPAWTPEEDAILVDKAWMSPERVVLHLRKAGFSRTLVAVSIRMKRKRTREHIDGMSANGLAQLLGIDAHAVTRWIERGWLRASLRADVGGVHDKHYIANDAIRGFFYEHPEQVELSKLERVGSKLWFLEMITGGRISEHGPALPAASSVTDAAVNDDALGDPDRTVALYGERVTLTALSEIAGRSVAELLGRIDGQGMSVEGAAFGEDAAAPAAPTELGEAIAGELHALMQELAVRPAAVATRAGLPKELVVRLLAGTLPVLPPPLLAVVGALDAEVQISIEPRVRRLEVAS